MVAAAHAPDDAAIEDLRKAAWYIEREIERRERNGFGSHGDKHGSGGL